MKQSNIISELFFSSDFDEVNFKQERKIILNELAESLDDPTERIEELLLKSLFKEHPVKRPVGGYTKTIKQLTLNELTIIHRANYVPQNMILILTGNFNQKTTEMVLKDFEDRTIDTKLSRNIYPAETAKPPTLTVEKKPGIAQTYLSIGARTVPSTHVDAAKLDLLSVLLSGGTSSRLFVELREKNALTYDVNSDHNKGLDFGFFSVSCAVKNKNLVKAKELIFKELSKLRTEKVSDKELKRNKNLITSEILRGMDNPQECSEIIAYLEMQFKSEMALVDYISRINAVSDEDIVEAANTYLNEDCLATVLLKPIKK